MRELSDARKGGADTADKRERKGKEAIRQLRKKGQKGANKRGGGTKHKASMAL